jgi:hypothetical protein
MSPNRCIIFAERELDLQRNVSGVVLKVKLDQTAIVE